jgi:hypothetical protein
MCGPFAGVVRNFIRKNVEPVSVGLQQCVQSAWTSVEI